MIKIPPFLCILFLLFFSFSIAEAQEVEDFDFGKPNPKNQIQSFGGIIRGDTTLKKIALVFTGDTYNDGGEIIASTLSDLNTKASFFLTGNFYRNPMFKPVIEKLIMNGHYMGVHSDGHLLYCDWNNRDSLLVTKMEFKSDLLLAYAAMQSFGIRSVQSTYFLPPFEWYNDSISKWTKEMGLQLINFTPGTRSNADYTYPEMGSSYIDSKSILLRIFDFEVKSSNGLNGFILLLHIGTDPRRTDKFYRFLPQLIEHLKGQGYRFVKVDDLLM